MANVWILPTIATIMGLGLVGLTTYIGIRINKGVQKIDISPNAPFIDASTRRQFTNGYSFGLVKRQLPRKNDTVLVEFYPLDMEQGENKPRPELQSVVVAKQFIKSFARGELSQSREVIKISPRTKADLPEKMRDELEGDWATRAGQLAHIEKTFSQAIVAGDEAIHEAMRTFARGNIARATLAQIKDENAEFRKLFLQNEKQQEEVKK